MATQKDFIVKAGIQVPGSGSIGNNLNVANNLVVTQNVTGNNATFLVVTSNTFNTNTANLSILVSNTATINVLNATSANIATLTVTSANLNTSTSNTASAKTLSANVFSANTSTLKTANVETLTVRDIVVTGNSSFVYERGTLLRSYREYVASSNSTPTVTLDLLDSNIFKVNLVSNTAFSLSNVPVVGTAASFTIIAKQATAGSRITWPANTVWSEGIAPTQSLGLNQTDVFTFLTIDAGAMIIGSHSFANVS